MSTAPVRVKVATSVPYDATGSLIYQPAKHDGSIDWRDNEPFFAELQVVGQRAVEAVKYVLLARVGNSGQVYPMLVDEMVSMLVSTYMDKGMVRGRFTVRRRGDKYTLSWLPLR